LRELRDAPLGGHCGETIELERREPIMLKQKRKDEEAQFSVDPKRKKTVD
jgi:hypothetical protein